MCATPVEVPYYVCEVGHEDLYAFCRQPGAITDADVYVKLFYYKFKSNFEKLNVKIKTGNIAFKIMNVWDLLAETLLLNVVCKIHKKHLYFCTSNLSGI